jgi:hypothetical protein
MNIHLESGGVKATVNVEQFTAFEDWGAELDADEYPQVALLSDHGVAEDVYGLQAELISLKGEIPESVEPVLDAIFSVIRAVEISTGSVKDALTANRGDDEYVDTGAVDYSEIKATDNFGLRPDEIALPPLKDDPNKMRFSDAAMKALEITGSEADKELIREGGDTEQEKRLLKAKKPKGKQ